MRAHIDSLPLDALVQILCKLNHDQLKPLLGVSKSFHNAALVARQSHFDFSTPAPKRTMAVSGGMGGTPGAPSVKPEFRKPRKSKLSDEETRRIAVVLFPTGDCKRGLIREPRLGITPRYEC